MSELSAQERMWWYLERAEKKMEAGGNHDVDQLIALGQAQALALIAVQIWDCDAETGEGSLRISLEKADD